MKNILFAMSLFGLVVSFSACNDSGDEESDPCQNGPQIAISSITNSIEGQDNGVIIVSATGGTTPYMFTTDGTNYQSGTTFSDLEPGMYDVTVKDANECTSSTTAEVLEIPVVSFADEINPIIQASCQIAGCHGSNTSIPDFSTYDNIKAKADRIKARTSDGTMPPTGALPAGDVKKISDWVEQGAPNN